MLLRKLTAVFALTGLFATISVADTSLCRMFCAELSGVYLSSKPVVTPHLHHSASSPRDSSVDAQANHCAGTQQSIVSCGESALQSPPCTQYEQLARFLNASRASATEKISSHGSHALLPAALIEEISEAAPLPPMSPTGSYVFPRSTPTFLRI